MDEDCKSCFIEFEKNCICIKCVHDNGGCDCELWEDISPETGEKNKDIDIFTVCNYYKEDWVKVIKYG